MSVKEVIEQNLEVRSQASSRRAQASHHSHATSRFLITSSRAKEKVKAAELMAKVAIFEQRQELEKKAERLCLVEQLAVAQVRERVFTEIENDIKEDLSHQPEMSWEASRVPGISRSGPSFLPVSSIYTVPSATSNTVTNVNFTAGFHDAPITQTPPKPTWHPTKLNPLAPEFHIADTQPNTVLWRSSETKQINWTVGGTTTTEFSDKLIKMVYFRHSRWLNLLAILWNIPHLLEALNRKWKLKSAPMFVCNTWSNTYKENWRSSSKDVFIWIETATT